MHPAIKRISAGNLWTYAKYVETSDGLRSDGSKAKMLLDGNINTADAVDAGTVEKLLTASQNNKQYKITWQHSNGNKSPAAGKHVLTLTDDDKGTSVSRSFEAAQIFRFYKNNYTRKVTSLQIFLTGRSK